MKRCFVLGFCLLFAFLFVFAMQVGPAPNAGDGIPDGSGMDGAVQNGDSSGVSMGPAPNAGDGIPDGSGF